MAANANEEGTMGRNSLKFPLEAQVAISFWDHVEDSDEPMLCKVWGQVAKDTKLSVTVISWDLPDAEAGTRRFNQKTFTIVKSAIIEHWLLG